VAEKKRGPAFFVDISDVLIKFENMFNDVLKKSNSLLRQDTKDSRAEIKSVPSIPEEPISTTSTPSKSPSMSTGQAFFSEDVEFKGTLCFSSKFELNGRFEGEIQAEGPLVVGDKALVKANITGVTVVIRGKVQGNVTATERVELTAGAHLYGDVRTPKFTCSDSAVFVGSSNTLEGKQPAQDFGQIFTKMAKSGGKSSS
jgi:cytoskeletal protein CcmA (bactofilin family)